MKRPVFLFYLAIFLNLFFASLAFALDLNAFRAQHKLPPLSYSATLAGAAYEHAHDMANRQQLDHKGFKARAAMSGGTAAENVSYGCEDEDCAIRQWAKSAGHRRNMLMKGVSAYGIASAKSDNGRTYRVMMPGTAGNGPARPAISACSPPSARRPLSAGRRVSSVARVFQRPLPS